MCPHYPFPKSHGNPKSMNKLTLNEAAISHFKSRRRGNFKPLQSIPSWQNEFRLSYCEQNSIVSTDNSLYYYFKNLFSTIVRTSTLYLVVWAMVHLCQLIYCYSSMLLLVSWTQDTHCLRLSFCVGSAAGKQTTFLEAFHRCSVSLELLKVGKLKGDHFNRVRYRKMKGILTFRSEV